MCMAGRLEKRIARLKEALTEYAYLITLGAAVAMIAATAMYTERLKTQSSMQAAAGAPEIGETPEISLSVRPEITPLPTIAPLVAHPVDVQLGGGKVWPVSGGVIRGHSQEEPVFWEALSCIQVHAGTDIAGRAQEDVLCIMDGVVERVTQDELWGWRVRVAQVDGSTATYAGLSLCALAEGQAVTRGQVIGMLSGGIPCEAEMDAHLHLELERNGEQVDPQELLENAKRS